MTFIQDPPTSRLPTSDHDVEPDADIEWDDGTSKWMLIILCLLIVIVGLASLAGL